MVNHFKFPSFSLKICFNSTSVLWSQTFAQEDNFFLFHLTLAFTLQRTSFHIKDISTTSGFILLHIAITRILSCPELEINLFNIWLWRVVLTFNAVYLFLLQQHIYDRKSFWLFPSWLAKQLQAAPLSVHTTYYLNSLWRTA